jgi:hypothetical protein
MVSVSHVEEEQFQIQLKLLVYAVTHSNIMIIQGEDASIVLHSLHPILMIQTVFVDQAIKNKMDNVYHYAQLNLLQIK